MNSHKDYDFTQNSVGVDYLHMYFHEIFEY